MQNFDGPKVGSRPARTTARAAARGGGGPRARRAAVWAALAAATLVKLYLALTTEGTLDVAAYADYARTVRERGGLGLYHDPGLLSPYVYLPFGVHLLRLLDWLAAATPLPFAFWLRLPCILADAGGLLLVWKYFEREAAGRDAAASAARDGREAALAAGRPALTTRQFASLLLLALSPVSLLVSGFHGNTDPLMIFLALLSLCLVERGRGAGGWRLDFFAGLAFGMAVNLKIVPLIFFPAVWFYLAGGRARLRFCGGAAAAVVCVSLPYVLQEPLTIARAVFGYQSLYGTWGWSYLLARALPSTLSYARPPHGLYGPHAAYAAAGKWLTFAVILAASVWMNRAALPAWIKRPATPARTRRPTPSARPGGPNSAPAGSEARPSLVAQCALILCIFLALTPGFGTQYLAWLVPFVAARGLFPSLVFNAAAGCFVLASYACWFYRPLPAPCSTYAYAPLMLAAWLSVILILFFQLRPIRRHARAAEARP